MEFGKRLTNNARDAISAAEIFARSSGSDFIGTEHLLLGIANQNHSEAAHILFDAGITFDKLREKMKIGELGQSFAALKFSPTKGFSEAAKLSLRMSIELANEFKQDFCSTEHMFFSLLNQQESSAVRILRELNADVGRMIGDIEEFFREENEKFGDENLAVGLNERQDKKIFLSKFSRNLTDAAKKNELDPVIGRKKEVERAITILSRRQKNNPVLIGEAGVGKTAIVEGIAEKIAAGKVPTNLREKQILQIDLANLVAGTKFRGEFEERIQRLITEAKKAGNVILFIDELHLLSGAGAGEGSMDAANILKPALARGEIRLIGATTNDEYRKNIEKDAALARRFQTIEVNPPTFTETIRIIQGLREKYEKYHNVKLNDKVIELAVRLSDRYLTERFQPDKTLDVIDEAAAKARISYEKNRANSEPERNFAKLSEEKTKLTEKKEASELACDYEKAALYKMRISRIDECLADVEHERQNEKQLILKTGDIESAVAQITGIPVEKLSRTDAKKMLNLEKNLSRKIIGQSAAIREISRSVKRNAAGINRGNRPIGSFIFLGPTGVGKTETARVLAQEVFGGERNLIKIDMSEFSEAHSGVRLTGAPAGYVGYDDGGNLTEKVRRNPYSVVLFDEIEKAHPRVFNLLLQILEDGNLTDGHGRKVDFSNTIIILTSNIGATEMTHEKLGFRENVNFEQKSRRKNQQSETNSANNFQKFDEINPKLREIMRPELLNRFDAIVEFNSLNREDIAKIFDLQIEELNERLIAKGVRIFVAKNAKNWLIDRSYDAKFGARPLRRAIENEIEDLLADALLMREFNSGDTIKVVLKNDKIALEKSRENSEELRENSLKTDAVTISR